MKRTLLAATILLAFTTPSFGQHEHATATDQKMKTTLTDGPYIDAMTKHHDEGLSMAQLAVEKASHARVKELATTLAAEQKRELKELEHLKMTPGKSMGMGMGMGMGMEHGGRGMKDKGGMAPKMPMADLETMSGAHFDRMFLETMVKHHQEAIRMSRDAKLKDSDLKEFAQRSSRQQETELRTMQQLLKQID